MKKKTTNQTKRPTIVIAIVAIMLVVARIAYQPTISAEVGEEGVIMAEIGIYVPYIGEEVVEGNDTIIKVIPNPAYVGED